MITRLVLGGFLVLGAAACQAWNASGHMVIAAIAEENLLPITKLEVERLLKVEATPRAYDFITSSAWADDVRPSRQSTAPWHYINFYLRLDGKKVEKQTDPDNALSAFESQSAVLRDRSKGDLARADALRFLIHIAGDLHQPLHASSLISDLYPDGDRGGNDYKIRVPSAFPGNPTNLHSLWDSGLGLFAPVQRPLNAADRLLIKTQALSLAAAIPFKPLRAGQMKPETWAKESHEFARRFAYSQAAGTEASAQYIRQGQAISARRAVAAGYRLATFLNSALTR